LVTGGSRGIGAAIARRLASKGAAVAVLTQDGHLGATYEPGGTPFTLTALSATISDFLGTHIAYQDMSVSDLNGVLTGSGLPPEMGRRRRRGCRPGSRRVVRPKLRPGTPLTRWSAPSPAATAVCARWRSPRTGRGWPPPRRRDGPDHERRRHPAPRQYGLEERSQIACGLPKAATRISQAEGAYTDSRSGR